MEDADMTINGTYCPKCGQPMTFQVASEQYAKFDGYDCPSCTDKSVTSYERDLKPSTITDISYIDALCMFQSTPSAYIKSRPGRGGKRLNYVEGHYMKRCATIMTNGRWSSRIDKIEIMGDMVVCVGSVTMVDDDGYESTKYQCGGSKLKKNQSNEIIDIADDFKSACTDMVKKCLNEWGLAHDVYSGEVK